MSEMKNRSLVTKIFIAVALTFLFLGGAIYFFIYLSFPQKYMENKKKNVEEEVMMCLSDVDDVSLIYEEIKTELLMLCQRESVCIDIFLNDDFLYSINNEQSYSIEDMQDNTMVDTVVNRDLEMYEKTGIKKVCIQGEIVADIYVPFKEVEDVAGVLLSTYPVIIIITVFLVAILSLIAAWQISRPIVCIINKVNDMSTFNHIPKKEWINENTKDEIKILDGKLENMYYMLYESQINMENELKNQMKQEKFKFDFLRMAAHELKTPLTSVNGMLEGMYYNISPYDDREKYLLECQKVISDMNHLIKEMLLSTELSHKNMEDKVYIKKSVEKIMDIFAVERIKKKIKLAIDIEDNSVFCTNKEMFESALKNILHNSVIYCEENGTIDISMQEDRLHIFNSCKPLKEDEIGKIFEAFYRGKSDNDNGNGLGLYLVKRFLDTLNVDFKLKESCINGKIGGMDFILDLRNDVN